MQTEFFHPIFDTEYFKNTPNSDKKLFMYMLLPGVHRSQAKTKMKANWTFHVDNYHCEENGRSMPKVTNTKVRENLFKKQIKMFTINGLDSNEPQQSRIFVIFLTISFKTSIKLFPLCCFKLLRFKTDSNSSTLTFMKMTMSQSWKCSARKDISKSQSPLN